MLRLLLRVLLDTCRVTCGRMRDHCDIDASARLRDTLELHLGATIELDGKRSSGSAGAHVSVIEQHPNHWVMRRWLRKFVELSKVSVSLLCLAKWTDRILVGRKAIERVR